MSLVFRRARPEDVPGFALLGAHSFPAARASLEEWRTALTDSPFGGLETLWLGEQEGRLVAGCQIYRFEQWIAGAKMPVMGLGTVTIANTSRRQGLAARLTGSALRESRDRGDLASVLYPFRTAFYRKLGYGLAGEVQQYRFPPAALPDHPGRFRVSLAVTEEERAVVAQVYDRWAPLQSGQMVRSPRAWSRVWEGDRHGVLYREDAGAPAGYAVFRYLTEPARGGRSVEVEEIAWLTREARLALYAWLASLSDQWDFVVYRAHPQESFAEHLAELRFPVEGVPRWHFWFPASITLAGPMFRLLDVERAWRMRRVRHGPPLTVAFDVRDPQIEENDGRVTLHLSGGEVVVDGADDVAPELEVTLGIEALSRIFIGSLKPTAAVEAGLATVDPGATATALATLDQLLDLPSPWTFDRF